MEKINLADAVIAVTGTGAQAKVRVFRYLDQRANAYDYTWGACESMWEHNPDNRFRMLFEVTMFMMRTLGISPEQVAQALRPIPECCGLFDD
jgi:hypothetical protein